MAISTSLHLPTHNHASTISHAITSILRQTHTDFELLIWDDGSTDNTADVAAQTAAGDPRVRIIRSLRRGVAASLDAAIRQTSSRYIAWIDSDDALAPTALARTIPFLDAHPEVGMVYTQHFEMDEGGEVLGIGRQGTASYSKERLLTSFETCQFRLIRRTVFDEIGGLDETLPSAQDYDLCLRLSEITRIVQIPEPLYYKRVQSAAHERGERVEQILTSRKVIRRALVRRGLAEKYEVRAELVGKFRLRPRGAVAEPQAMPLSSPATSPQGIHVVTLQFGNLPYFPFSTEVNYRYCVRHRYPFAVATPGSARDRHPIWYKIKAILDELPRAGYVLFVDADAVFVDHEQPAETLLRHMGSDHVLMVADNRPKREQSSQDEQANVGVMLVKNDPFALELFAEWWQLPTQDPSVAFTWPCDEAAFNKHLLGRYRSRIALVDHRILNGIDGDYIRHFLYPQVDQKTEGIARERHRLAARYGWTDAEFPPGASNGGGDAP